MQPNEYLDNVKQVSHIFSEDSNDPLQLTPEQFVNGFVHVGTPSSSTLESATVKLASIKDVVNYTGYQKEGLVFRFMLMAENITDLIIQPGPGDSELRTQDQFGRLEYEVMGKLAGSQGDRELGSNEYAQFIVRLSDYQNPRGAFMEMYLIGKGKFDENLKAQQHTANKSVPKSDHKSGNKPAPKLAPKSDSK